MNLNNRNVIGPPCYANWIAYNNKENLQYMVEYPLYTDARVTGEIINEFGPYKFLNTVPMNNEVGLLQPSIVLRAEIYLKNDLPQMAKMDDSFYHGGWLSDELAALVSLCLGIRVKAGGVTRRFDCHDDQFGRPEISLYTPQMLLREKRLKLPSAISVQSLEKIVRLKKLPSLSNNQVIAIIRAARLYEDALWIGESEPALSWLMFVSALEAGANVWHVGEDTPLSKLESSKPDLYKILQDTGIDGLTEKVANQIVPVLGATNKFIKFVMNYLPNEPNNRPPQFAQIKWSNTSIKNALNKIYGYRSRALHGGIPFPAPMCDVEYIGPNLAERPLGSATYEKGGTWMSEDLPMFLHVFEHITRGVLLNWLDDMMDSSQI